MAEAPITLDVRMEADERIAPKHSIHPVQIALGMVLWIAHCIRSDLMYPASTLSSRITTWSALCQAQLVRLLAYVKFTENIEVDFHVDRGGGNDLFEFLAWTVASGLAEQPKWHCAIRRISR